MAEKSLDEFPDLSLPESAQLQLLRNTKHRASSDLLNKSFMEVEEDHASQRAGPANSGGDILSPEASGAPREIIDLDEDLPHVATKKQNLHLDEEVVRQIEERVRR